MESVEKTTGNHGRNRLSKSRGLLHSDRGKLSDPGTLYQNVFSKNDDWSTDGEDDSIQSGSTLDESGCSSIQSFTNSAVNSLMYSEDDSSAKSFVSPSISSMENSILDDTKQSQNLLSRPLFMNVDVVGLRDPSGSPSYSHIVSDDSFSVSSSACDTKESLLTTLSVDHYFQPTSRDVGPSSMLQDWTPHCESTDSDSEHYIFTDDDNIPKRFSNQNSNNNENPCAASEGIEIPSRWRQPNWNNENFRKHSIPRILLEHSSRANFKSSNSSLTEKEYEINLDKAALTESRLLFFEIAFDKIRRKRIFSNSTSPLDNICCNDGNRRRDIQNSVIPAENLSAFVRNELVSFGSWERNVDSMVQDPIRLLAEHQRFSASSQLNQNSFLTKPVVGTSIDSAKFEAPLSSSDFINETESELLSFMQKLEEPRASSEEIAKSLNIEIQGKDMLRKARENLNVHVTNAENQQIDDNSQLKVIPLVYLYGNLWMPQYEVYVTQSVKSFAKSFCFRDSEAAAVTMDRTDEYVDG